MKTFILMLICFVLVSCKTGIVDHYECKGRNEELISSTLVKCIEASKEEDKPGVDSIKQNPIHACKDVTEQLLCTPVYKEII